MLLWLLVVRVLLLVDIARSSVITIIAGGAFVGAVSRLRLVLLLLLLWLVSKVGLELLEFVGELLEEVHRVDLVEDVDVWRNGQTGLKRGTCFIVEMDNWINEQPRGKTASR